jgi:predicted permease
MSWYTRLLDTFRLGRLDRELDEEMRYHIDMRTEAYRREGLAPDEARRKALRRFGSPLLARERVRDVHLLTWLDSVRQDVWLGLRLLRRTPTLTIAAVLSLGLAIGGTTGVFAVGDALLIRPLPVQRPEQLVIPQWHSTEWPKIGIWGSDDDDHNSWSFSYPMYEQFVKHPGIDLAGFQDLNGAITLVRGEAGTADGSLVTGNFFRVLGIAPLHGRFFVEDDNRPASPAVVVLSHRFWLKAFGGDIGAIGSTMRVNGQPYTIVGVAPQTFFGLQPGRWSDLYVPACRAASLPEFATESMLTNDHFWWLQMVGRLRPGTTPASVQASLGTQFAAMVKPHITEPKQNAVFGLRPGARGYAFQNDDAKKPIVVLMSLVVVVLLIACSNVANLLLARGAARRKEAAMRLALGAGRLRLARQHVTESLMLALVSGAGGFLFARWFAAAMLSLAPQRSAMTLDLGFSWRVLAFDLGVSLVAGLLVGLAPAIALSRSSVSGALRAGVTVRTGWKRRFGLGRPLVAVQIALSLLLLVVAGLFVRSLGNLQGVPLGFNPDGLVLFNLDPTAAGYSPVQKTEAIARIAARLRQVPHVTAVTWSSFALVDNFSWNTRLRLPGDTAPRKPPCNLIWVEPGFHGALQIPLVAGRFFDERDNATAPKVAIVNQAFVTKYLEGARPLGQSFIVDLPGRKPETLEIVGVVRNSKYARLRQAEAPLAFFPEAQQSLPVGPTFALKVAGQPSQLAEAISRVVHELEPTLPVTRVRTYREQIDQQLSMEHSLSLLSSAFGVVALLLAAIGLYGVVAFAVAQRTAEMGVRLALGASRKAVLGLMLLDSAKIVVPGACVGMAAALAATRFVESILYGLKPTDPATIVGAMALLLTVAAAAAYLPARRAAGINPVEALRCE